MLLLSFQKISIIDTNNVMAISAIATVIPIIQSGLTSSIDNLNSVNVS